MKRLSPIVTVACLLFGLASAQTPTTIHPISLPPPPGKTVTGNLKVKGNITATGSIAGSNTQTGIPLADKQPGANAGAKITACIAALPPAGGICDARGFGATTQTISKQVDIGGTNKAVTLLINPATQFQCTENAPTNYCLRLWNGSHIRGEGNGGPLVTGNAANFTAISPANLKGVIGNWPRDGTVNTVSLQNLVLRSSTGSTISEGLLSLSGIYSGSYFTNIDTVYCGGGGASLYMTSPSAQVLNLTTDVNFYNDNFDCGNAPNSGHAIEIIDGAPASGIGSINFYGIQAQHSGLSEIDINGNGSGQCSSILFSGLHTESAAGLVTTPAFITINDCHNVALDHWNTSGVNPTDGSAMTVAQSTPNATHDLFIRDARFGVLGGGNIVSSTVSGISSLPFRAQDDTAMSLAYWSGLPLASDDSPRYLWGTYLGGAIANNSGFSSFTPDKPITITRIDVNWQSAMANCTVAPTITITDGTNSITFNVNNAVASQTATYNQNYTGGTKLTLATANGICVKTPSTAMIQVQYKMQ